MKRNPAAANLAVVRDGQLMRWVFFRKTGACESVCVLGRVLTLLQLGGCAKEPWRVFGHLCETQALWACLILKV